MIVVSTPVSILIPFTMPIASLLVVVVVVSPLVIVMTPVVIVSGTVLLNLDNVAIASAGQW